MRPCIWGVIHPQRTTFNLVEVLRSKYALLVHIEIDHGPLFEPQMTQMLRHKIAADTPTGRGRHLIFIWERAAHIYRLNHLRRNREANFLPAQWP